MFKRVTAFVVVVASVLAVALSAAASVVTEADGAFSRQWKRPTEIGFGADTILGIAERQNQHEFIVLSALPAGAQSLTFDFTAPDSALSSYSYSAGGQVLWSTEPFRHAWDGQRAGAFQLSRSTPSQSLEIALDRTVSGPVYLGVYFTHGRDVSWQLSAPGNRAAASPVLAPIPVPAAAVLLLGGLATFAAFRRRSAR